MRKELTKYLNIEEERIWITCRKLWPWVLLSDRMVANNEVFETSFEVNE